MKVLNTTLLAALLLCLLPFGSLQVRAEIPQLITYQGRLVDSLGTPVADGKYDMSFALYDGETETDPIWLCEDQAVAVEQGLFTFLLGDACALDPEAFLKRADLWLEIEVKGVGIYTPRIKLTSTPFAYHSLFADTADYVHAGTSGWTDAGSIVHTTNSQDSVGIGTNTPTAQLDVAGDINSSASYQIGGNQVFSIEGTDNLFAGEYAGQNHSSGERNTYVGQLSGASNSTGSRNTFVGLSAGRYDSDGTGNTYLGHTAGSQAYGDTNTYVGISAGGLTNGSGNVFIGAHAGYNADGSNMLYIANNGSVTPLIYGNFATSRVGIGTTSPGASLHAVNESGTAIKGEASGLLPTAINGTTSSTGGTGVYGRSDGQLGVGVRGYTSNDDGKAVSGHCTGLDSYAIYGRAEGHVSYAVYGLAEGSTSYGVYGNASGTGGIGLYGEAVGGVGGIGLKAVGYTGMVIGCTSGGHAADLYGNVNIYSQFDSSLVMELGEGLDYAEGFSTSTLDQIEPGTVMIIDQSSPGELCISTEPYDTKVAGIVAGANGLGSGVRLGGDRFDVDIALAGRVYCLVEADKGAINTGDLLTTSGIPGHAMKAEDVSRAHGAIIGKAMEPLRQGQRGMILVLVTLH